MRPTATCTPPRRHRKERTLRRSMGKAATAAVSVAGLVAISAGSLAVMVSAEAASANLVKNPGFENGVTDWRLSGPRPPGR